MKQLKNKEKKIWKRKKSRAERWTPSRLASLTENLSTPSPPPTHYCSATTFAVFCIPVSFWSDLDWFCYSVLTLRQNIKTSPKRVKTTPKFVTLKLLIYANAPKWVPVGIWSRGEVLPAIVYTEKLCPKWVPFSGFKSGIWKGRNFTCWSIWKCREIGHFGR